MKILTKLSALLVLSVWLIPTSPVLAKSPPDKLILTGPDLEHPVEITDPASLSQFGPWTRWFVDWGRGIAAAPPPAAKTYEVAFFLDGDIIYVLEYAPDPSAAPGRLFFPGVGDPRYSLNIGTIITGDSDRWDPNGKWQYATEDWDTVMHDALSRNTTTATTPVPSSSDRLPSWILAVLIAGLAVSVGWTVVRRRLRRPAYLG